MSSSTTKKRAFFCALGYGLSFTLHELLYFIINDDKINEILVRKVNNWYINRYKNKSELLSEEEKKECNINNFINRLHKEVIVDDNLNEFIYNLTRFNSPLNNFIISVKIDNLDIWYEIILDNRNEKDLRFLIGFYVKAATYPFEYKDTVIKMMEKGDRDELLSMNNKLNSIVSLTKVLGKTVNDVVKRIFSEE